MIDDTELHDAIAVIVTALAARGEPVDQPITREDLRAVTGRVDRLAERLEELLGETTEPEELAPRAHRPLYTVALLCERLGLSDRVVRQMLSDNVIPSFRVGGARRIDPEAVDEYLARQRDAEPPARRPQILAAA